MVFARSAAMAFNRYLDRAFDAKNPRTAIREIPKGIISAGSALRFVIFNCIAFIVCTWFINPLCTASRNNSPGYLTDSSTRVFCIETPV